MSSAAINIGVIGLGRAFTLMLQTFTQDKRVKLAFAISKLKIGCKHCPHYFHRYESLPAAGHYLSSWSNCADSAVTD